MQNEPKREELWHRRGTLAMRSARSMGSFEATSMITASFVGGTNSS